MAESKSMAENAITDSFPVSIIMERSEVRHRDMTFPQWKVVGFVAGEHIVRDDCHCTVIHSSAGREQYLWTGYTVRLYKDSAESYWYNLVGANPYLFVLCREHDEYGMAPFIVSANYDEANAFMEVSGTVFSAPIPPVIYQWLERYVVENYQPQEPKKRSRMNWTKEGESG